MKEQQVSYQEILQIRKDNRFKSHIPYILFYEQTSNGYKCSLSLDGVLVCSYLSEQSDIDHFESNVIQFCNKSDVPESKLIKTHDFSSNATWVHGANKSFYCIQPESEKELIIQNISGKIDKGITFSEDQSFQLVIWKSLSASCPAYNSDITEFKTPAYNPYQGIFTGWIKVYPPSENDVQETANYVYMLNNVPQYVACEFSYLSVDDFKDKAEYREDSDTLRFKFPFSDYGVFVNLRNSLNERIEMYTNDNNQITKPESSSVKSIVSVVATQYNEF